VLERPEKLPHTGVLEIIGDRVSAVRAALQHEEVREIAGSVRRDDFCRKGRKLLADLKWGERRSWDVEVLALALKERERELPEGLGRRARDLRTGLDHISSKRGQLGPNRKTGLVHEGGRCVPGLNLGSEDRFHFAVVLSTRT
jgi:hypothetical protein